MLSSDVEDHQGALCYLEESATELYKRTGDPVFKEEEMILLRAQFEDVKAAAEVKCYEGGVIGDFTISCREFIELNCLSCLGESRAVRGCRH